MSHLIWICRVVECYVWGVGIQVGGSIQMFHSKVVYHSEIVYVLVIGVVVWGLGVCCECVLGSGDRVCVVV